ncbi:MAG: PEP-CTERM sorting domain-containing protein [Sedimentisphaerales bacterium]|nr:PEP-CTERM sorting domain-containing protein [Sedimentisphaerales bacterium]
MVKKTILALCAAVVFALACSAQANPLGTVDMAYSGLGAVDLIQIWGGGRNGIYGYGGVCMFNKTAGTDQGDHWLDGPIGGFCMDLPENLAGGTLTYDVVMPAEGPVPTSFLSGPMGAQKADYLSELWYEHFDRAWIGSGSFTADQKRKAEAFAASVWEIIYEALPATPLLWDVTTDGTAGALGFYCAQADTATANSWLQALDGLGPKTQLRALVYNGKQDFLVAVPTGASPVPEPATVGLLGFGSLALFCTPGKRKKMR